jgi:hypothetical protein
MPAKARRPEREMGAAAAAALIGMMIIPLTVVISPRTLFQ